MKTTVLKTAFAKGITFCLFFTYFFVSTPLYCQNLVNNGGFENYRTLPHYVYYDRTIEPCLPCDYSHGGAGYLGGDIYSWINRNLGCMSNPDNITNPSPLDCAGWFIPNCASPDYFNRYVTQDDGLTNYLHVRVSTIKLPLSTEKD